jgi:hypothetical protein
MNTQTMLNAALDYASKGWAVFPCKAHDKTPITLEGFKNATTDLEQVRAFWTETPNANIGLACGMSGLVVVDIDVQHGGFDTWAELRRVNSIDDATVTSLTGGGGQHLIYRMPEGADVRNSASKLGTGVDIRGNGGYIVVPPSVHPNGKTYEWEASSHPSDIQPLPFPDVLLKLLQAPNVTPTARDDREGIPEGKRNAALTSLAGTMRKRGMTQDAITAALLADNAARCNPPLPEWEVKAIACSVAKYPPEMPAIPEPAKDTRHDRFKIAWADDAMKPQPPIEWVIDSLFSVGSVSLVVGEGGCGKTYAMIDAAVSVTMGQKWLDFETQKNVTLVIDEESGNRRIARRFAEVLRGHGAQGGESVGYITMASLNLLDEKDIDEFQNLIVGIGARFVVIDALADVMPNGDENSVKDVQPVFHALRVIANESQAAIVVIHHSNKVGSYRGSTALKGAVDLLLMVCKDGDKLTFTSEKARDIEPIKFAALANFGDGTFNLSPAEPAASVERTPASQEYVTRYLGQHQNASLEDIMGNADTCSPEAARKAVYRMSASGAILRTNSGGRGIKACYAIVKVMP